MNKPEISHTIKALDGPLRTVKVVTEQLVVVAGQSKNLSWIDLTAFTAKTL